MNLLCFLSICTSRNAILFPFSSSVVNWMCLFCLFRWSLKSWMDSLSCGHKAKTSSTYLHQSDGLRRKFFDCFFQFLHVDVSYKW